MTAYIIAHKYSRPLLWRIIFHSVLTGLGHATYHSPVNCVESGVCHWHAEVLRASVWSSGSFLPYLVISKIPKGNCFVSLGSGVNKEWTGWTGTSTEVLPRWIWPEITLLVIKFGTHLLVHQNLAYSGWHSHFKKMNGPSVINLRMWASLLEKFKQFFPLAMISFLPLLTSWVSSILGFISLIILKWGVNKDKSLDVRSEYILVRWWIGSFNWKK